MWNEKIRGKSLKKFAILLWKFHKVVIIGQASCRALPVCLKRGKARRSLLIRTSFNTITAILPLSLTDSTTIALLQQELQRMHHGKGV